MSVQAASPCALTDKEGVQFDAKDYAVFVVRRQSRRSDEVLSVDL
jgi:hypothetical protein